MRAFDRWHPALQTTVAFGLVAVIGYLDYVTGFEVSFAFFYVVPVALVAWSGGLAPGLAIAVLSAGSWLLANWLAGDPVSRSILFYWNAATRLGFFAVVVVLLARLRAALERERALSRMDHLTGVLNGRAFTEVLIAEIDRSRRYGRPFSVAYLDLDNFKTVNDRYGHTAGDDLLRAVAELIQTSLRRTDTVARLGGDEFAVLLPETDAAAAEAAVGNMRAGVAAVMRERDWPVTLSVGVLTCSEPPGGVDEIIARADALMYEAKKEGKDRVAVSACGPGR